ncbi:MAG: type VI secretion system baseplate subunit TssF [Gemmataceae bacterium]|nr:type VI secretion system baseplate subunit TssF [Gemmataceae bacterium]
MSKSLYEYYDAELYFIRKLARDFADRYPAAAARLKLEPAGASTDPHVERLIEAFALLAGRIRNKIHDEFPELTDALLSVLYPHALALMPSCAVVQFTVDPGRATPTGVDIKAGSPLLTARVADVPCKFRTVYPLKLWPLAVAEARLHPPPFPPGLNPPAKANAALRLRLQATGELTFDKLAFDRLRFHLLGDHALAAGLYDLLLNDAIEVAFVPPDRPRAAVTLPAARALRAVGFEPSEGLLPYPPNVFPGYRLLTEFFAYPAKFLFVDLCGWEEVRAALGPARTVDVVVFLTRSHARLEQQLDPGMLRLGCTPAVNLFEHTAEPIPLTYTKPEYRIVPEVGHPLGYEVFSVASVTAAGGDGKDREVEPFYHYQHGTGRDARVAYWYATRAASLAADDEFGTDVYLHLADAAFDPAAPAAETLVVRTLCTNRDLPTRLPRVGEEVQMAPAFAAPGTKLRCVRNPSVPLRPAAPKGRYWHVVSHLNLNHLSLTTDAEGLEALKGLLRLYDLSGPRPADPQAAALASQAIDGIVGIGHRRTTAWVGGGDVGGFARGVEVDLELDEERFVGSSGFLFASVLERFFGLYVSVNSFTQLVARFRQRAGELRRWPPRAGDQPLA